MNDDKEKFIPPELTEIDIFDIELNDHEVIGVYATDS